MSIIGKAILIVDGLYFIRVTLFEENVNLS